MQSMSHFRLWSYDKEKNEQVERRFNTNVLFSQLFVRAGCDLAKAYLFAENCDNPYESRIALNEVCEAIENLKTLYGLYLVWRSWFDRVPPKIVQPSAEEGQNG